MEVHTEGESDSDSIMSILVCGQNTDDVFKQVLLDPTERWRYLRFFVSPSLQLK